MMKIIPVQPDPNKLLGGNRHPPVPQEDSSPQTTPKTQTQPKAQIRGRPPPPPEEDEENPPPLPRRGINNSARDMKSRTDRWNEMLVCLLKDGTRGLNGIITVPYCDAKSVILRK